MHSASRGLIAPKVGGMKKLKILRVDLAFIALFFFTLDGHNFAKSQYFLKNSDTSQSTTPHGRMGNVWVRHGPRRLAVANRMGFSIGLHMGHCIGDARVMQGPGLARAAPYNPHLTYTGTRGLVNWVIKNVLVKTVYIEE